MQNELLQPEVSETNTSTEPQTPPQNEVRNLSIIEKIHNFNKLADSMDDNDQDEIEALLKDIQAHGSYVYDWIQLLEKNAQELKDKAKRLTDSARVQENKAKQYKDYLKTALKSAGFEKFPMGDFTLNLVTSFDYTPRTAPSEKDFIAMNEFVDSEFAWKTKPTVMDWVDHKDKIDRNFVWKMDIIKSEIKKHQKTLDLKKSTEEQKELARVELEKLYELVRIEEKYALKTSVNKLEK